MSLQLQRDLNDLRLRVEKLEAMWNAAAALADFPSVPMDAPLAPALSAAGDTCPNCGKHLKPQGAHFHIRACKGARLEVA